MKKLKLEVMPMALGPAEEIFEAISLLDASIKRAMCTPGEFIGVDPSPPGSDRSVEVTFKDGVIVKTRKLK